MGKNSPDKETTKFKVMFRLSVKPFVATDFAPREAIVDLPTEIYEDGVWSEFSTSSGGITYFLIVHQLLEGNGFDIRHIAPVVQEDEK